MRAEQTVSEMAQEVLSRQARTLANRKGYSLEVARQAVADTEAGRQLRDLTNGNHRHEKAQAWQASAFWGRAEERFMHNSGSEALSRFVAERHSTRGQRAIFWDESGSGNRFVGNLCNTSVPSSLCN